jgi:glucosamine--fructose-6-phosphate aminotransferase (isomerizing)
VFLIESDEIQNKVISNMQEIKARKGKIICIQSEDCKIPDGLADETIIIPKVHSMLMPILATVPVQLLSYYIAVERHCDVDKPRNLAKSVTVE